MSLPASFGIPVLGTVAPDWATRDEAREIVELLIALNRKVDDFVAVAESALTRVTALLSDEILPKVTELVEGRRTDGAQIVDLHEKLAAALADDAADDAAVTEAREEADAARREVEQSDAKFAGVETAVEQVAAVLRGDAPAEELPTPGDETPVETPVVDEPAPVVDEPVAEAPVEDPAPVDVPVDAPVEAPVEEAPVEEAPAADAPVAEEPAVEAPAEPVADDAVAELPADQVNGEPVGNGGATPDTTA